MSKALTIVNAEPPAAAPKKKREKIVLIETQPEPDWFVPTKTKRGRKLWYLRLRVTGWHARLYGPFASKHAGLLFLDEVLNALLDPMAEVEDESSKWRVREQYAHAWLPIVEHPVVRRGK